MEGLLFVRNVFSTCTGCYTLFSRLFFSGKISLPSLTWEGPGHTVVKQSSHYFRYGRGQGSNVP